MEGIGGIGGIEGIEDIAVAVIVFGLVVDADFFVFGMVGMLVCYNACYLF
jgi:hypothetical protein